METRIKRTQIVLEEDEARIVLFALDYLRHRQAEHDKFPETGSRQLDPLRKELRKALGL